MLRQCSIIFICLAIAELIVHVTHIHFPSSLLGMLILTFSLKTGLVKLEWVKGISDFLLSHLGLFFRSPRSCVDALSWNHSGTTDPDCGGNPHQYLACPDRYRMDLSTYP